MTLSRGTRVQSGAPKQPTHTQTPPADRSPTLIHQYPNTPENRTAPIFNHPPKQKTAIRKAEQHATPTHLNHRRTNSRYESPKASMSHHVSIDDRATSSSIDDVSHILPVTPKRNVLWQDGYDGRTASPRMCPSVDRSRRQSRYYRERSPTRGAAQKIIASSAIRSPIIQGGLLSEFNDLVEREGR
ncbi:hypothetical protein N431DRAFT_445632 [Stipitochalara longipes BDJ]|nr:hypothetical protein N431DRAFT_445632 [Stipitochalara longipes BDJ]